MTRPSRVIIDKAALQHNYSRIKQSAPHARVMAILKADAYGHGIQRIAKSLPDADAFGVAFLEEARQLRQAGILQPIILLEGPHQAKELAEINALNLQPVIHDVSQVEMLEQYHPEVPLQIWIKIDTGMHRLGFMPQTFAAFKTRLENCDSVKAKPYLMTHLATANEIGHPLIAQQLDSFNQLTQGFNLDCTIANSAAILTLPASHRNWVRGGLMLYGVSPIQGKVASDYDLKPVMTLASKIISIKHLNKGDTVGYGATFVCPEDMAIGVVAAGYGDGFPRAAKLGTELLVDQQVVKLIGRPSMDMLCVDLRQTQQIHVGSDVTLWGEGLPIEQVADMADTIPYELLCGVHKRLDFVEIG